jgi:hypothetical protein
VLAAMHGPAREHSRSRAARRHGRARHRHYHLAGAIAALVRTGFSDEQIHAAVIAPFIALFDPAEARRRRPGAEALALLAWARQQIGGPAPDVALPRPRWARA